MLKTVQVVVLLNLANCFSQCIATHPKSGPKWSIYDLLDELGLKSFSGLLETTGFMYTLSANASGPFTVYAPTDDAFNNLPPSVMKKLQNDDNWRLLHDLTSYHLTKGNLSFLKWSNNMITPTLLDGTSIRLNIYNNNSGEPSIMSVSGATLIKADQQATNGVVQVIDRVLYSIPDDTISNYIQENSRLRKLAMLMQIAGYHDSLDKQNITLFAPSDAVFEEMGANFTNLLTNASTIKALFRNHTVNNTFYTNGLRILDGGYITNLPGTKLPIKINQGVYVSGAKLVEEDVSLKNGVLHIINKLL